MIWQASCPSTVPSEWCPCISSDPLKEIRRLNKASLLASKRLRGKRYSDAAALWAAIFPEWLLTAHRRPHFRAWSFSWQQTVVFCDSLLCKPRRKFLQKMKSFLINSMISEMTRTSSMEFEPTFAYFLYFSEIFHGVGHSWIDKRELHLNIIRQTLGSNFKNV